MITKKQFDILVYLTECDEKTTQREIAAETKMSLGTVNKVMAELEAQGLVANKKVSEEGLQVLEQFRAKRAVFIAAGFGSRLVPITLNTPKPLIRVKGVRMIETLLDAVVAQGIEEIYIVTTPSLTARQNLRPSPKATVMWKSSCVTSSLRLLKAGRLPFLQKTERMTLLCTLPTTLKLP